MNKFDHEKLDVHEASIEWVVLADEIVSGLPKGRGYLADHLQRAAIVHVCLRLNLLDENRYEQSHTLLDRISAIRTKMVRSRR
jgi:hypothetical protein